MCLECREHLIMAVGVALINMTFETARTLGWRESEEEGRGIF